MAPPAGVHAGASDEDDGRPATLLLRSESVGGPGVLARREEPVEMEAPRGR